MFQELDPAVEREQRMAELDQIAKYRAAKLKIIQEWSDPVHRELRKAEVERESWEARKKVAAEAERYAEMFDDGDMHQLGSVTVIQKEPEPKRSWFSRLFRRR